MDIVVDYAYYKATYGGAVVTGQAWNRTMFKAQTMLNQYTFNRISEYTDYEKNVLCEMADCIYEHKQRDGKSSESTDGYSVSYDASKSMQHTLYQIVYDAFAHTGLMYCGVYDYAT